MSILYLGSTSASRQRLLHSIKIPFTVALQDADESKCDWSLSLQEVVSTIARYKMEHVQLPRGAQEQIAYVLTADTLGHDPQGVAQGKPVSRDDAIAKLKAVRGYRCTTGTAFCLDKRLLHGDTWVVQQRVVRYVSSQHIFTVPDAWIDRYLTYSSGMQASGAIAIGGYGAQFLELIEGSYSGIEGLPLMELRQELEKLGFWD